LNQQKKVKFKHVDGDERKQVGVDLSVLYKNEKEGELVYRLTEMYIPKSESQKLKRQEYNYDIMRTQNDDDAAYLQSSQMR
jgi:hypothetical protein